MKKIIAIIFSSVVMVVIACAPDYTQPVQAIADGTAQLTGSLRLNMANGDEDSAALAKKIPGRENQNDSVEHIWLTIKEVQIHTAGDTSDNGWKTVSTKYRQVDFLKLVNGLTEPLDLYALPAGHYTQIRLILAEDRELVYGGTIVANSIVVNGETFPLTIPSGLNTGIKCVHSFTIAENEVTEICLKFDALKAVHYAPGNGYMMKPAYKTYKCEGTNYPDYYQYL